jgi:hypothetical protein
MADKDDLVCQRVRCSPDGIDAVPPPRWRRRSSAEKRRDNYLSSSPLELARDRHPGAGADERAVDEDEDRRSVACHHLASMTPRPAPVAHRILPSRRQQTTGQAKRRNATWMSVGRSGATELVDEVSPPASPTSSFRAGEPFGSRPFFAVLAVGGVPGTKHSLHRSLSSRRLIRSTATSPSTTRAG